LLEDFFSYAQRSNKKLSKFRPKLDFVHFVMQALAPASQNGQSQRHFSMS
jgi:hypothetical protein